jgi:hypothetical protein
MATFYLDFENGNDANNGTTFANRWKSITSGATAARTAPGDTIRIMGSPAPTSLGQNGVWTSQALQATIGNNNVLNTTPITINTNTHGFSTGDTVVVTAVGGNTAANGTWEITVTSPNSFTLNGSSGNGTMTTAGSTRLRNNTRVKLTTAVTQNIASTGPGRAAWTASANVSSNIETAYGFKEHRACDYFLISATFTTGLAAYWPTGTIDLSGYQQVSFWIRQTTGTIGAAGAIDLRLCSDAAGVTAVNTISIPALGATGRWMPVTVDLATNLGNSIQSIALYVNTDNGAQEFLLNNIIACKASSAADSLTLTSLIGKNTTGETFWGIQSINGTRVMLDADTNATPTSTSVRGYYGTSETVTTWKRETIKLGPAVASSTTLQTMQESGTDGSPITYSGGWDRTNMSTQDLETWLDGVNGNGYAIGVNANWINTEKLAFVRLVRGISHLANNFCNFKVVAANNCTTSAVASGIQITTSINTCEIDFAVANASTGIAVSSELNRLTINNGIFSNGGSGIYTNTADGSLVAKGSGAGLIANNSSSGAQINTGGCIFNNLTFEGNSSSLDMAATTPRTATLFKCLLNDSAEVSIGTIGGASVYSQNHDQTTDNHKIFLAGALISSATDQRKTASGISWKIQPTSTNRNSTWPVTLSLAKVACSANNLVTIKAWMYRDNAGLTMRLVCKGGQIAGVASDVTASVTTTNAWEEETITFTPTETGVVEITAEAWGGTTFSGWVDDMTISQA